MKRITLKIEDELLSQLRVLAAEQGRSVSAVVNALLMQGLTGRVPSGFTVSLRGWDASLQPGADIPDRDKLFDLMDGL